MKIDLNELRALPASEKLRLVEMLWDDLANSVESIPLPEWVQQEATRRYREMVDDPTLGLSHQEVWDQIDKRS